MEEDKDILEVVEKLLYIIDAHKIKNAYSLKKFIYTHNLEENEMRVMKEVFNKYDEMNVYNCVIFFHNKVIPDKEILIKKIKGI